MNRFAWFLVPCLWGVAAQAQAAAPALIPVQGFLTDDAGVPIDGDHKVIFFLYDAETDGTLLHTDTFNNLTVNAGQFVVYLGNQSDNELDLALFRDHSELWLDIVVDNETITPRTRLGSVPYAGYAEYCGEAAEAVHAALADEALTAATANAASGALAQQTVPAGAVMAFDLAACPAGWSELAAARGRTVVGTSPAGDGISEHGRGDTFGSESVSLTPSNLPPHSHAGTTDYANDLGAGDTDPYRDYNSSGCGQSGRGFAYVDGQNCFGGLWRDHQHPFTTDDGPGSSQAINLSQPSIALLYCRKD